MTSLLFLRRRKEKKAKLFLREKNLTTTNLSLSRLSFLYL